MGDPIIHRKDEIILACIDIIDECGIHGLSTKNIAQRVGISEGTIFRHFKNKSEILQMVLDYFSKFDDQIIQSISLRKPDPLAGITFFMSVRAEYYENYPAITAIAESYHELANDPELTTKVKDIYRKSSDFLFTLIKEGQRIGQLKPEINAEYLSDVIVGLFRAICLKWRFAEQKFSLKEQTLTTLKMVLESFS